MSSGFSRPLPLSDRGIGLKPASPSRRQAAIQRSIVVLEMETSSPSGVVQDREASERTTRPRSTGLMWALSASEITE